MGIFAITRILDTNYFVLLGELSVVTMLLDFLSFAMLYNSPRLLQN